MSPFIIVLAVALLVICVALIGLVLMQDSKGGMGSLGGGATTGAFGAHTDKALVKATTILSVLFFVLTIFILVKMENTNTKTSVMGKVSPQEKSAPNRPDFIKKDIDLKKNSSNKKDKQKDEAPNDNIIKKEDKKVEKEIKEIKEIKIDNKKPIPKETKPASKSDKKEPGKTPLKSNNKTEEKK